jgi:hypothetical protein
MRWIIMLLCLATVVAGIASKTLFPIIGGAMGFLAAWSYKSHYGDSDSN